MPPRIAFQASLPRPGSTLLSNIIGQNPDFHVTPTSGLLDLVYVARGQFSRGEEFKAQERGEMEQAFAGFCRGGLEGYAAAVTDKPWLLDKSRGWGDGYKWAKHVSASTICTFTQKYACKTYPFIYPTVLSKCTA